MNDNQLINLFVTVMEAQFPAVGLATNFNLVQEYQPTQQGAEGEFVPSGYFYKVGPDKPYGFPKISDVWDTVNSKMVHTELQQYESRFQMMVLSKQNPNTPDQLTASDIARRLRYCVQSQYAVDQFEKQSVGVYKVLEIGNVPFLDDSDQFEYAPAFDFILTHKETVVITQPIVDKFNLKIESV